MIPYLKKRVEAKCNTELDNDWYKDGRQVMITPTHQTKDRFNVKLLQNLKGDMTNFPAKDNPSKHMPNLLNLSNLNEAKTKGLLTQLNIKKLSH